MPFTHQCLIFDLHPAVLLPQFHYLLFRSECLYVMYVYKVDLISICCLRFTRPEVFILKGKFVYFIVSQGFSFFLNAN